MSGTASTPNALAVQSLTENATVTDPRAFALAESIEKFGIVFEDSMRPAANYNLTAENNGTLYLSGQLPRTKDSIAVVGMLGQELTLEDGRRAAAICAMRSLRIAQKHLGGLDQIKGVIKMNVYVHCDAGFTQHSEVADAASEILYSVLQAAGGHARTAVGVSQLPKGAAVELDLIFALAAG